MIKQNKCPQQSYRHKTSNFGGVIVVSIQGFLVINSGKPTIHLMNITLEDVGILFTKVI